MIKILILTFGLFFSFNTFADPLSINIPRSSIQLRSLIAGVVYDQKTQELLFCSPEDRFDGLKKRCIDLEHPVTGIIANPNKLTVSLSVPGRSYRYQMQFQDTSEYDCAVKLLTYWRDPHILIFTSASSYSYGFLDSDPLNGPASIEVDKIYVHNLKTKSYLPLQKILNSLTRSK